MYAEDKTYITRMDDTVFLGTTAIDIRTFCDLFRMTIDNGIERRIQMLTNHMIMNKRASLPPVNLDGVVKEYYRRKESQYELKLAPLHPKYKEQLEIYHILNSKRRPKDEYSMMKQRAIENAIRTMEETKRIEEIADRNHQYYRSRCLGEFVKPSIAWPKQKPWGYLHEDGTKQYI